MYDKTITICNKLKKIDSGEGTTTDTWIKTVLTGVEHYQKTVRTMSGNTVSVGVATIVLIPFNKGYLPYDQWKLDTSLGFTVSAGDIVFLDMELSEEPTSANITSLKTQYGGIACKSINIIKKNGIALVEVKIEGV